MEIQAADARASAAEAAITAQFTLNAIERQVINLRRQAIWLKFSARAARVSAQAATQYAKASLITAEAAKTSADIAARVSVPTLVIEEFELAPVGNPTLKAALQFPRVRIVVRNYGQSPALMRFWTIIFAADLPEVPIYRGYPGSGIALEKVVVKPGTTLTLENDFFARQELTLGDVEAIVDREKTLRAYGLICYGDIFNNPLKRLKFCELALNLYEGPPPSVDWVAARWPPAYIGADYAPINKSGPWQGAEGQAEGPDGKAE